MTYCIGMLVDSGLVFLCDSRTNAGVDQISTFRKLTLFERQGDRVLVAMCAGKQRKFWEVHDLIFRNQATWAPLKEPGQYFLTFADSAGLDRTAFQKCLQSGATRDEIEQDAVGAVRSGATSTPTFYIEGGLLEGAVPAKVFRQVLDSILTTKAAAKP